MPRNVLKSLFMRFYFNDTTPLNNYTRYKRSKNYKKYPASREVFDILNNTTFEIIGKSFQNLIFIYTSILEVLTVFYLKYRYVIRVFNVYDGFYCNEDICGLLKDIVHTVSIILKGSLTFEKFVEGKIDISKIIDSTIDNSSSIHNSKLDNNKIDRITYIYTTTITLIPPVISKLSTRI